MKNQSRPQSGVTLLTSSPCTNTVVGANEVFADKDSVIAVSQSADQLAIDGRLSPMIAALVVGTQWVGEGA
jgi:hypothetical protein